jgi:hypothetical protein
MENNRVKQETTDKYFKALVELRNVLRYTNRISLDDFSIKNNLSKNLSKVLQKGGIIKCLRRGRYSEWEWTTIEPTIHMAVKTIQLLGIENPPRKPHLEPVNKKPRGGYRENSGRKTKEEELSKELSKDVKTKKTSFSLFWGLISFKIEN